MLGCCLVLWTPTLSASEAGGSGRRGCLLITHVGSEDHPIGSARLCPGNVPRATQDSVLTNDWTFEFDAKTYRQLESFIVRESAQPPLEKGLINIGTFSVTRRSNGREAKYLVPTSRSCRYLGDLVRSVSQEAYGEFVRVMGDIATRVGCFERPERK